jgi:hypothetical protein
MPQVYEVNVRPFLADLSEKIGRQATLDDLPNAFFQQLAESGFNWIYLLGAWTYGEKSRQASVENRELRSYLKSHLRGFNDSDIVAHVRAPAHYSVPDRYGADEGLARLRQRLNSFGLSLMLDFIPNQVGLDHAWATEHPDFFVTGTPDEAKCHPERWITMGGIIIAHGKDPNFPPWKDTLQLDYSKDGCQTAMISVAKSIARRCDGLKCHMAMLQLPDVFHDSWGRSMNGFWERCISTVRQEIPATLFLAEVYWGREHDLHRCGFDFTYDKVLYDRLRTSDLDSLRRHLHAGSDYQQHCVRFLENNHEQRAATVFSDPARHRAALFVTGMLPGMFLCHQGQELGRQLYCPLEAGRWPDEVGSPEHRQAYHDLFGILAEPARQSGNWQLLEPLDQGGKSLIATLWTKPPFAAILSIINVTASISTGSFCASVLNATGRFVNSCFSSINYAVSESDTGSGAVISITLPPWGVSVFRIASSMTQDRAWQM